ncbi:unnamed protein product [Adineta steineri]|uniref:Uncharacterized protein n=1 Tax=Adineta steineri TaxID=433720 RepID=A0A814SGR4_9BILA|nr:unnamed protein product [Adineta steineri]
MSQVDAFLQPLKARIRYAIVQIRNEGEPTFGVVNGPNHDDQARAIVLRLFNVTNVTQGDFVALIGSPQLTNFNQWLNHPGQRRMERSRVINFLDQLLNEIQDENNDGENDDGENDDSENDDDENDDGANDDGENDDGENGDGENDDSENDDDENDDGDTNGAASATASVDEDVSIKELTNAMRDLSAKNKEASMHVAGLIGPQIKSKSSP